MGERWWIRPLLLTAIVAAGTAVAMTIGIPPVEEIRAWVSSAGWAAPALFALFYAALALTPAPATVTSVAAGVLFGLPLGLPVVLVGATVGAAAGFALARVLGRDAILRIDSKRREHLDTLLLRRGLLTIIGMRLVPLLPFAVLNYACGLSAVKTQSYLLGTAVGILPAATVYVTIGAFGAAPGSTPFLLAVGGLVALLVAGLVVIRRRGVVTASPWTEIPAGREP